MKTTRFAILTSLTLALPLSGRASAQATAGAEVGTQTTPTPTTPPPTDPNAPAGAQPGGTPGTVTPTAGAEVGVMPGPSFGKLGQLSITEDSQFEWHEYSTKGFDDTSFRINVSGDYFIRPKISVGGAIGWENNLPSGIYGGGYSPPTSAAGDAGTWRIGPSAGYHIALAPNISLWPKLGLYFAYGSSDTGLGSDYTVKILGMQLFAPFLYHPGEHFFIGMGPVFGRTLMIEVAGPNPDPLTDYGLQTAIGGYWSPF